MSGLYGLGEELWQRLNAITENNVMVHTLPNGHACVHTTKRADGEGYQAPTLVEALSKALSAAERST